MAVYADPFGSFMESRNAFAQMAAQKQQQDMQRQEFELRQREAADRQAELNRQRETEAIRNQGLGVRYSARFGVNPPPQAMRPPVPMPMNAPAPMPSQPVPLQAPQPERPPMLEQAPQMAPDGQQVDRVVVTGQQDKSPSLADELEAQARFYAQQGRWDLVDQVAPQIDAARKAEQEAALAEEESGYKRYKETLDFISGWATEAVPQIEALEGQPNWQGRLTAMVQGLASDLNRMGLDGQAIMEQARIDPGETPMSIAQELRLRIAQANRESSVKRFYLPYERQDLGNRVAPFDPRTGQFGQGVAVGVSPDAALSAQTQRRGQNVSAANTRARNEATIKAAILSGKIQLGDEVSPDEFAD